MSPRAPLDPPATPKPGGLLRKLARKVRALKVKVSQAPVDFISWLPYQVKWMSHEGVIPHLLRLGNRMGKSTCGAAELIFRARGKHPFKEVRTGPVRLALVCFSLIQSVEIQRVLWELLGKENNVELVAGTEFSSKTGFKGHKPVLEWTNGSELHIYGNAQGAGALAGSSLPLDPTITAAELGFGAVFDNSLDAVADRDFVADALYACSMLGVHLSRIGEELILWASTEFGFVTLDDGFSTGSSMMPQKKNPDIAELARGKAGRLVGHLTGFLTTVKGLPLTYNKDMQEDKEPLFDAIDTVCLTLLALDGMISTTTFNVEAMAAQADTPYAAATDLAEWLVARGMPFRDAHAVVGEKVRRALAGEGSLHELVVADPQLGDEAAALLAPGVSVTRRTTRGGGAPAAVAEQITRFRAMLDG